MRYVVLKDNQIDNVIIWDGLSEIDYPFTYDEIILEDEYISRLTKIENEVEPE